ncbi:MAG: HAMP domain-containing sensor histidine kinase [Chthoniobacterales bacterium]
MPRSLRNLWQSRPLPVEFREEITTINLRHAQVLMWAGLIFSIWATATNWLDPAYHSTDLYITEAIDLFFTLVFLFLNYLVRGFPPSSRWRSVYVWTFLILLLSSMDAYYFASQNKLGHTSSYILGVAAAGAFLLFPPRVFLPVLVLNHTIYCVLLFTISRQDLTLMPALIQNTAGTVITGVVSWLLFCGRLEEFYHRKALAVSHQDLEKINVQLNEMVAVTAHDLRSPLLGVRDLLAIVQREEAHSDRTSRILLSASDACARMLALVNRLVETYTVEQEADLGVNLTSQDIRKLLTDAAERARITFANKGTIVETKLPDTPVVLALHTLTLARAVDNLLSNAVKFSHPQSTVNLILAQDTSGWYCDIIDEGPGLSEKEHTTLFKKFHRGNAQPTGGETTTGLGLFIVATSMKSLHGSVEFVRLPDKKTCFRLRFG